MRRSAIAPTSATAIARKSQPERERRAVEVAARLDAAVGQDHRVVDGRAAARRRRPLRVRERVARRAGHLRRAAQRVGVLHAVVVPRWRRDDRRAGEQRAQVRGAGRLAGLGAQRDEVGGEGAVGAEQRLDRHRRGDVGDAQQPARSWVASTSIPSIPSVPLISASPSLAPSASGSAPLAASASAPSIRSPSGLVASPSPISTSAQWASGARSPLAPSEPCSGTTGVTPALSSASIVSATSGRAPERPIASVRARSSIIARTDLALHRRAHAGGVRADERALQLLAPLVGDRHVGQRPEAGRDAVGRLRRRPGGRRRRRSPPSPRGRRRRARRARPRGRRRRLRRVRVRFHSARPCGPTVVCST